MRVAVEVTGHSLVFPGGARYAIGERLLLNPENPQHREVLDADGWVRRVDQPPTSALDTPSVVDAPAVDKMVSRQKRGTVVKRTKRRAH